VSGPALRFGGRLETLAPAERERLGARRARRDPALAGRVAAILERVRAQGDAALAALARELDGAAPASLEVPRAERRRALAGLDAPLLRALERAARNIATWHRALLPRACEIEVEPGIFVGRRPDPIARLGVYAPGGRASYPSSVLMAVVPARVAGVAEVILCSPPGPGGSPSPLVLAAAEIAGADRVFAIGGAGAIAAMAHGTATVPAVDRIVGPGNAFVAEAKLQVQGVVSTDSPAGPSELLAILDEGADPALVARELLAQAEHDPDAAALAVAVGEAPAAALRAALARALPGEERREVIAASFAARGGVLVAATLEQALEFANDYAPEHLLLAVAEPERALARVRNAGSVFLGGHSSVAFGDYMTGANHTLPTGGAARSFSGLSIEDFVRWTTWQRVTREAAAGLAGDVAILAAAERLPAHAAAARAFSDRG
jgi:histidinol dehydrogenase